MSLSACRAAEPVAVVEVRSAWARPADSAATTAAYLAIVNHDTAAVVLTAVASSLAESVTLHETMLMSDMVHMAALSAPQSIASGDSLVLVPNAKHLMVMSLRRRLAAGDSLPLDLTFGDGRVVRVYAVARAP